jgi:hypothetical protein
MKGGLVDRLVWALIMAMIGVVLGAFVGALGFLKATFLVKAFWFTIVYFAVVGFVLPETAPDVFGDAIRAVFLGASDLLGGLSGPTKVDESVHPLLSILIVVGWVAVVVLLIVQMPSTRS